MEKWSKPTILITLTASLVFGFLHHLPGASEINFTRLHIFLFNLCSGGTMILYFTEGRRKPTASTVAFFVGSILFTLFAFLDIYSSSIACALVLAVIVESIRIRRFSVFPTDFFRADVDVAKKFHQASLLCLSMGLLISSLVIVNQQYYRIIESPMLVLDVFFLGFSFPVSLITMCVMFEHMKANDGKFVRLIKNLCFWSINLGVIIFFIFIILVAPIMELSIAFYLFLTVMVMFGLYLLEGTSAQQKSFLTSGMLFLLITALTGIGYIAVKFYAPDESYYDQFGKVILLIHAFAALYGWNLSGLIVISRLGEFPISINSKVFIAAQWLTVVLIAPLGKFYPAAGLAASLMYMVLLVIVFYSRATIAKAATAK